jgi:hypothetical protein
VGLDLLRKWSTLIFYRKLEEPRIKSTEERIQNKEKK